MDRDFLDQLRAAAYVRQHQGEARWACWFLAALLGMACFGLGWLFAATHFASQ